MTEDEVKEIARRAWLAGLFDGDGCVSLKEMSVNGLKYPRITIAQKNQLTFMIALKERYGGYLVENKAKPGNINWHGATRKVVVKFLSEVLPYLHFKKRKATIALALWEMVGNRWNLTDRNRLVRFKLQEEFDAPLKKDAS